MQIVKPNRRNSMSENANQPISRTGSEISGNGGHFDQGGRRTNPSGNRNNRRRRPSQQIGGEQSANHAQRPSVNIPGASVQHNAQAAGVQTGKQQNPSVRQDPYQQRRSNNRPQRQNQAPNADFGPAASHAVTAGIPQNAGHANEKPAQTTEKQIPTVRNERTDNQAYANRKNVTNPAPRVDRPREPRTWGRNIRTEETHEDIHRENERIEKEIWLEIASIHTYKLD